MARSDLVLSLVEAGKKGDRELLNETIESLIAEERAKEHHIFAERLSETMNIDSKTSDSRDWSADRSRGQPCEGLVEVMPEIKIEDLILPEPVTEAFSEVVEEHNRKDLLRSYNLEPRHRILLAGPPGNGKTSLAEALGEALMMPIYSVQYERVIGSYLGETASRLEEVFKFVRQRPCVLFFDEFDVVGKERGDENETGEIKRVVSSLLLQIDDLPSHVIVVVASNHPELLDKAVWRRFQLRLQLPPPNHQQIIDWLKLFERKHDISLKGRRSEIADTLQGVSFAEVEQFGLDILRQYVMSLPEGSIDGIVQSRIKHFNARYSATPK